MTFCGGSWKLSIVWKFSVSFNCSTADAGVGYGILRATDVERRAPGNWMRSGDFGCIRSKPRAEAGDAGA